MYNEYEIVLQRLKKICVECVCQDCPFDDICSNCNIFDGVGIPCYWDIDVTDEPISKFV